MGKAGADGRGNDSAGTGIGKQVYGLDEQGRPRIFFHGTASDFSTFDLEHPQRNDRGWLSDDCHQIGKIFFYPA